MDENRRGNCFMREMKYCNWLDFGVRWLELRARSRAKTDGWSISEIRNVSINANSLQYLVGGSGEKKRLSNQSYVLDPRLS